MKKYNYAIGIDPGTHTGLAVWRIDAQQLWSIETMPIHKAFEKIKSMAQADGSIIVRFEDAGLRKWFGNTGAEKWKGAGSIMRDCSIWEEFLTDLKIPFEKVAPKNNITKLRAEQFRLITGYTATTNEHGRDAAMLVFNYKNKAQ